MASQETSTCLPLPDRPASALFWNRTAGPRWALPPDVVGHRPDWTPDCGGWPEDRAVLPPTSLPRGQTNRAAVRQPLPPRAQGNTECALRSPDVAPPGDVHAPMAQPPDSTLNAISRWPMAMLDASPRSGWGAARIGL